MNNFR